MIDARRNKEAGFSLPQVMVASLLGMVALAAITSFNQFQLVSLRKQATQIDVQTAARNVVDIFSREVRRAGMNPACAIPGFSGIAEASSYSLRVQSDLNGNGVIGGSNEDIKYRYNFYQQSVERVDPNGVTDVLVSGLSTSGSRLRYFDGAGNELGSSGGWLNAAERSAVRRVRIELALTQPSSGANERLPLRAQISTDVNLRNRYFVNNTACPGS